MLIYVYVRIAYRLILQMKDLLEMLRNLKYPVSNPERLILVCLAQRLRECEVFPHEIGLFLGIHQKM